MTTDFSAASSAAFSGSEAGVTVQIVKLSLCQSSNGPTASYNVNYKVDFVSKEVDVSEHLLEYGASTEVSYTIYPPKGISIIMFPRRSCPSIF